MRRSAARTLLLALSLTAPLACREPAPPPVPLHLVVVCIDTLRVDHVGAWGYSRPTTPTIDALAARGTLFEDALATSNWTVPSVASLFTSLSPARHGAGISGEVRRLQESEPPRQIPPIVPTLAKSLGRNGYRTGLFSANPFLYGHFKDGFETARVERVDATTLTDAVLSWLDRADARPSFLYAHYMDAHQPNLPPAPYFQAFATPDGQPHGSEHADWSYGAVVDVEDAGFRTFRDHRIAVYDGAIRYLDAQLARLFTALEQAPYRGRTLLVVTADHGEEFWDHALEQSRWRDDPRGFWGVGHGHTMYQELLRVPLIVAGPDVAAARRDPCPVSLLDVAPTLLAAARLEPFPRQEGVDLGPRLREHPGECPDRGRSASSPAYGRDSAAVVLGGWKAIRPLGRPALLFDLEQDPGETRDLSAAQPRRLALLLRALSRMQPVGSKGLGVAPPKDSELAEELRALGYI